MVDKWPEVCYYLSEEKTRRYIPCPVARPLWKREEEIPVNNMDLAEPPRKHSQVDFFDLYYAGCGA